MANRIIKVSANHHDVQLTQVGAALWNQAPCIGWIEAVSEDKPNEFRLCHNGQPGQAVLRVVARIDGKLAEWAEPILVADGPVSYDHELVGSLDPSDPRLVVRQFDEVTGDEIITDPGWWVQVPELVPLVMPDSTGEATPKEPKAAKVKAPKEPKADAPAS